MTVTDPNGCCCVCPPGVEEGLTESWVDEFAFGGIDTVVENGVPSVRFPVVVGGTEMFAGPMSPEGCELACKFMVEPHFKQNFAFVVDSYPQEEQMLIILISQKSFKYEIQFISISTSHS